MGIDASIPLQGRSLNLAQMYAQAQQMKQNDQMMDMRQRQMDLQEKELIDRMDQRQREAAKEGVKDLHNAVRWADTPEKWAQVQQHYAQYMPEVAQYGFEQRESAILRLGQLGDYLEATKPDIRSIEAGGGLYSVTPQGVDVLVQPNDGSSSLGAPATQEGATATNPSTGEKIIFRNGQWQPMGSAMPNRSSSWTPGIAPGGVGGNSGGPFR